MTAASHAPGRPARIVRWLLAGLLAAFLIGEWAGWRFLHGPLEAAVSRASGSTVRFEDPFRLRLVPRPEISAAGLTVQAPPRQARSDADTADLASGRAPLASLGPWSLSLGYGDLLDWPPVFETAAVAGGTIHMDIDSGTQWAWPWPRDPAEMNRTLPVRRLSIPEPLEIRIRDSGRDLDLTVALTTPREPSSDALSAHVAGQWSDLGLDLRAMAPRALAANLGADRQPLEITGHVGDGTLAFKGAIGPPWSAPHLRGDLDLTAPSLAAALPRAAGETPRTAPVSLSTRLELRPPNTRLRNLNAEIGESRFVAELDIDTGTTPPRLSGSVDAAVLRPADLQAAPQETAPGGAKADADLLPDFPIERGTLKSMDVSLELRVTRLGLTSDRFDDLRDLSAKLAMSDGVLKVEEFTGSLARGEVGGWARLDASDASHAPTFHFGLRWRDIDIAQWLTGDAAGAFEGRLDGEAHGESTGDSANEMLRHLDGRLRARTGDARVSNTLVEWVGLDIAEALGAADDRGTPVSCVLVDLPVADGVAETRVAVANTPDSLIYATGRIDLAEERLDLRLVSSPKDWSPFDLDAPITVTGRFAEPEIGIATGPIAEEALTALVLGAVNPIAAILPMMEFGTEAARSGCRAAREAALELADGARGG